MLGYTNKSTYASSWRNNVDPPRISAVLTNSLSAQLCLALDSKTDGSWPVRDRFGYGCFTNYKMRKTNR